MIRIRYRFALVLALVALPLLGDSPARAQNLTHGVVAGVVRDSTGTALDGSTLTLRDRASGATRTATTARDGRLPRSSSSSISCGALILRPPAARGRARAGYRFRA